MTNRHYKFSISLSILFAFLIILGFDFFIQEISHPVIIFIIPGLVLGWFIKEATLIRYFKSALRESLIFGLIFGVMFGLFISFSDRDDIVIEDGVLSIIGGVLFGIGVVSLFGFSLSFFGSLIAVIPKYFASLKMRR